MADPDTRPEHDDEQKEQHRLGTINRWDPPERDWASDYDWTRYRGPDPWPVPGGWVFESPEAGGNWEYFGDAGVGHDDDNSILDEMEVDDDVDDPYGRLDKQRGERAWLNVETANPEDVSLRNPADEELKWTLQIGNIEVFSRVEPDRSDLMAAVAEALAAYHEGDLDERVDEITPATGRVPDDVREQEELEQREEENESLDEFATDGGETIDRFTELPTPDRFFMQIEPAEIEVMQEAAENSEPIAQAGRDLANAAIAAVAAENGRTVEEQQKRMGDGFAYQSVDDDPHQRQLDDYRKEDGVIVEEMPVSSIEVERRAY